MHKKDWTGERIGQLIVVRESTDKTTPNNPVWKCKCYCGRTKFSTSAQLRKAVKKGRNLSCGCERSYDGAATHGHSRNGTISRTYRAWSNMISRCTNPNVSCWKNYGGRGITICKRWRDSFESFLEDMGEVLPGLTLERIDNSKGYKPGNCKWASWKEQGKNRRPRNH